jgi:hypothetical protein
MRKSKPKFASAVRLSNLIMQYFERIKTESEPPTISGLALHLGFHSLKQVEQYEATGKYAWLIQNGRLRIIAEYEKKLLNGPSSGAIYALKSLLHSNVQDENKPPEVTNINLKTEIITTGPPLASSERDVVL